MSLIFVEDRLIINYKQRILLKKTSFALKILLGHHTKEQNTWFQDEDLIFTKGKCHLLQRILTACTKMSVS